MVDLADVPVLGLISLVSGAVGAALRPVGDDWAARRSHGRVAKQARTDFQIKTLDELAGLLERWQGADDAASNATAKSRIEVLTFQVDDAELQRRLELLLVQFRMTQDWRDEYGNVLRRLGEVRRKL